jgi:hypothetical protein
MVDQESPPQLPDVTHVALRSAMRHHAVTLRNAVALVSKMPEPGSLDLYINDNSKNGTGPKALDIYKDNKSKSEAGLKSLDFCIDGNTKNERRKSQDRLGMCCRPQTHLLIMMAAFDFTTLRT